MPLNAKSQRTGMRSILAAALLAAVLAPAALPLFTVSTSSPASAQDRAFTDGDKKAIGDIIKEYLLANPEVLVEAQTALEAKMEKQQAEKLKSYIEKNARDIYRHPQAPVAGNANGDITVVEFFDYNCGYCKRGTPEVVKLIEIDKNVRLVLKEMPILSKGSEEASKLALAARSQGKYWEMHQGLMNHKGQNNEASALKIAADLGLDVEKLKADAKSAEVTEELARTEAMAREMGINGTPHFLVGDQSIPGAPEDLHVQLEQMVTGLRKTGCSYC